MINNIPHITRHAPPGGITINGKFYKGGRFIPNEEYEKAAPEEKKAYEQKLTNRGVIQDGNRNNMSPGLVEEKDNTMQENSQSPAIPGEAVKEPFYIIDNGSILGSINNLGYYVIRNNPVKEPTIFPKELKLLSSLNTFRLDLIIPESNRVISIVSENRLWPETSEIHDKNIFPLLASTKNIDITEIPLEKYDILSKLSPSIADIFRTKQKMRIIRLRKISDDKEIYLVQDERDNKNKIERLHLTPDNKKICLFINRLYTKLEIPAITLKEDPHNSQTTLTDYIQPDESSNIDSKQLLKSWLVDILTGNYDALGENNHHILPIKGIPTRTHFNEEIPEVEDIRDKSVGDMVKPYISSNTEKSTNEAEEAARAVLGKITSNVLEDIFNELNIRGELRQRTKDLLLRRLELLRNKIYNSGSNVMTMRGVKTDTSDTTIFERLPDSKPAQKTAAPNQLRKMKQLLTIQKKGVISIEKKGIVITEY